MNDLDNIQTLIVNYRKNNVARRLRTKDIEIKELRLEVECLKSKILKLEGGLLYE